MVTGAYAFNVDLRNGDVLEVSGITTMFDGASAFNQPLTRDGNKWNTSNVTNMTEMFKNTSSFNQDLTSWCVTNILAEPANFATSSALTNANKPVWGTCP